MLETAGLIEVDKGYEDRCSHTWVAMTQAGNTALAEEIARLKQLIAWVDKAAGP